MTGVGIMIVAALLNAVASVLQRRSTRHESDDTAFSLRLVWNLLHQPGWILGILSMVAGFVLHAVAITVAGIAVVQPVLVVELPFTVLLAAWVFRLRAGPREWVAIMLQTVGLAAFLGFLAPTGGDPLRTSGLGWLVGIAASVAVIGAFVVAGLRVRRERRAAWLGVATGVMFGLNSALVSGAGAAFVHGGLPGLLTAWQTYGVVIVGPVSFFLLQNALEAGNLVAAQPGFTLGNPLTSVAWGLLLLGEHGRTGGFVAGWLVGATLVGIGTVLLASSPLLGAKPETRSRASSAS